MANPTINSGSSTSSKASSKVANNSSNSHIAVQCGLGAVFFTIWILVNLAMSNEPLLSIITNCLPYYAMFVLGILSRYMPGVKNLARRLKTALPT